MTFTDDDLKMLAEVRRANEQRTPGPWASMPAHWGKAGVCRVLGFSETPLSNSCSSGIGYYTDVIWNPAGVSFEDGSFIAACGTHFSRVLEIIDSQAERIRELEQEVAAWKDGG